MSFQIRNGVLEKYTEEPGVTEVVVPDGVTEIGEKAFQECACLTSVVIPDGVTRIGDWAFHLCKGLIAVSIPDSVKTIGSGAFMYCESLLSVVIPDNVTEIAFGTFSGCTSLTSVMLPCHLTRIGDYALDGNAGLVCVTIPDSVTEIGVKAFVRCRSVTFWGVTFSEDPRSPEHFEDVIFRVRDMVRDKQYDADISSPVKYPVLWQLFCAEPDRKLATYIKENFAGMFPLAIGSENMDAVSAVCKQKDLLTAGNINSFIQYANEQGQLEIQLLLMNYKNELIGYDHKPLEL